MARLLQGRLGDNVSSVRISACDGIGAHARSVPSLAQVVQAYVNFLNESSSNRKYISGSYLYDVIASVPRDFPEESSTPAVKVVPSEEASEVEIVKTVSSAPFVPGADNFDRGMKWLKNVTVRCRWHSIVLHRARSACDCSYPLTNSTYGSFLLMLTAITGRSPSRISGAILSRTTTASAAWVEEIAVV